MTRRIAMISEHASPLAVLGGVDAGGQNVYVAHLARQLASRGDKVDVYTRRDDPELPTIVDWMPGVRVVNVPAGPPEAIAKEALLPHMGAFLEWIVRDWAGRGRRYDLVHANFFMSGLVAADLKRLLGLPFLITFHALGKVRRKHQGPDDGFPAEREEIETRIIDEADRIIAECPQDEVDLIRLYGADPRHISIVPCGYDPAEFSPQDRRRARQALGIDPNERVLLQLGRMVKRKGVDTVIEALGRLHRVHGMPTRLLIVGGSGRTPDPAREPELARLMEVAAREGVSDAVSFVGRRDRDELAAYYSAADVFVSTPWYEPFGITPLEAMACGTPVIGSDVGGLRYTIRDGETGFLVPPRDPDALADRLARLLSDRGLRARFGQRGLQRVEGMFTWRQVGAAIAAVYDEVLAEGRKGPAREAERRPSLPAARPATTTVL